MTDYDLLLNLLDKDVLTKEEKNTLMKIYEADSDAEKNGRIYLRLKSTLKRNGHIDEELMGGYILYKNNITSDKSIVLLASIIEDHIRGCGSCEFLFTELNSEYNETDSFISNSIKEIAEQHNPVKKLPFYMKNNVLRYAFSSIAVVVILYLGMFAVSSLTTPSYKSSFIEGEEFYTTRGRTTELFQRGLDAIDNSDFNSAAEYLNEDIKKNNKDESIFYTYYVLGITYVNKAESDFIGLFKSYNSDDVEKGIACFRKSIELNNSGRFDNLNLDAHYYLGKSYLLIERKVEAKEHLEKVIQGKGSFYKSAGELLSNL